MQPMLKIVWREGPKYPTGIQTPAGGVIAGKIISAGGFSRHPKEVVRRYPDAFGGEASGFTKLTLILDPENEAAGWTRIADFPLSGRQSAAYVVVEETLYCIGGFSYTDPQSYRDVCRLQFQERGWKWDVLPCPLPWPVCEGLAAAIGSCIYLVCGTDFTHAPGTPGSDFHAEAGRDQNPVGQGLFVLDTKRLQAGWQRLADLPGTPRGFLGGGAAGGKIYALSGIYAPADRNAYYNVVDNWVYDPATDRWSRLPDMPDAAGNRHAIVFRDRYILLVAGGKYEKTWTPDGRETPAYGPEPTNTFIKTVLVYDTRTDRFGAADPLLEQTATPTLALYGDHLYSWGGEGGLLWHPDTVQIGKIEEVGT